MNPGKIIPGIMGGLLLYFLGTSFMNSDWYSEYKKKREGAGIEVIQLQDVIRYKDFSIAQCLKGDCINGQGTYILVDGEKYVSEYIGEFKDSRYNGQGTLILASGEKYTGEFKDNKKHGQGTLISSSGEKYTGEFKDGNFVK